MDCRLVILVFCVWISASSSDASQVTATLVGKDVTLRCQIPNLDSDPQYLYWRKDGKTVYSLSSNGQNADGKYSVIDTTSLFIPDVDDNDAGNFSCKVVHQSLATDESDIIQLFVLDLSVSNCKDTRRDVDGCSCYISGADIASLKCSASGFPHSPVITWDESQITYRSSSVDLTRFSKNTTLVCKAQDKNLQSVAANKTVCVYYPNDEKPNGPREETTTAPINDQAPVAAILISIFGTLAFVCLALFILWIIYRRKMGKDLCLRTRFVWTSAPKKLREPDEPTLRGMNSSGYIGGLVHVFKDSFKNSEAGSVPDISKLAGTDHEAVAMDHGDYATKDCNEGVVVDDEQPFPWVGQVLLDDLKSSEEENKESMKAVIVALLEKRTEPYKNQQQHLNPSVTIHHSSTDMNTTLQRSMKIDRLSDPDASFVDLVLQDLDQILDERDRDECEILITKPDFQEVTDESEIPDYLGNRVIHQSFQKHPFTSSMHSSTPSHMTSSMMARIPLSSVLREKLLKKPSERSAIRNAISQIILDFIKKGHSGLRTSSNLNYSTGMPMDTSVDDEVSRLVAFWTSKTAKLDSDVNNRIRKYLFPLKPKNTNKRPDADPLVSGRLEQEEQDEIPETPSSAKLLEESTQR